MLLQKGCQIKAENNAQQGQENLLHRRRWATIYYVSKGELDDRLYFRRQGDSKA